MKEKDSRNKRDRHFQYDSKDKRLREFGNVRKKMYLFTLVGVFTNKNKRRREWLRLLVITPTREESNDNQLIVV